jgi:hypothetical protein
MFSAYGENAALPEGTLLRISYEGISNAGLFTSKWLKYSSMLMSKNGGVTWVPHTNCDFAINYGIEWTIIDPFPHECHQFCSCSTAGLQQ